MVLPAPIRDVTLLVSGRRRRGARPAPDAAADAAMAPAKTAPAFAEFNRTAVPPLISDPTVIIETTVLVLVASASETPTAAKPASVAPKASLRTPDVSVAVAVIVPADVKLMVPPTAAVTALSMWASSARRRAPSISNPRQRRT